MKCFLLAVIAALSLALAPGGMVGAQPKPEFQLGFKALAGLIPEVVGVPLEAEHWGANGDSLQQTTTGLMVWRKADNWTAFTDGSQTWINGPAGIQSRANSERFPWEPGGDSGSGTPVATRLTLDKLKNAAYEVYGQKVPLSNGTASLPGGGGVWLDEGHVLFGDLDGDGFADAAALLGYSGGGSGTFTLLAAVVDRDGAPVLADVAPLGDRIVIRRMVVDDAEIQIRMLTQGPNDPMATPTLEVDRYYRLVDGKFKMSVQ